MDFNLINNVGACYYTVPKLLYYSHIPTAIIALFLGFYVYLKNRRLLAGRLLLTIGFLFFTWAFLDIYLFAGHSGQYIMFFWSLINLVEVLISATTLYFAYSFIEKKDISFRLKVVVGLLLTIFAILIPTKYNLSAFKIDVCEGEQGYLTYYYYFLEALFSIWLIFYLVRKIAENWKTDERKKTIYFSTGIVAFLLSFSGTNILSSALTAFNIGILGSSSENWKLLQYGLFGMPVFMAFLAYLIVQYKIFDIKIIGTQALVIALIVLIASMLFVNDIFTARIIIGITLILIVILGWRLVRSVKLEVQRKEELERLSTQLAAVNDKLHVLDKAKSEFISIASHQLRTPLTSIKGFGSLLLEGTYGPVPDTQRNALEKIYIANERLIQLVEDLLNISRIEAGRMEFDFQKARIEELVDEVVKTLDLSAKARNLYLHWQKPPVALSKIKVDVTKIKEVISNMVDNAIKYTLKGGVTVRVESGNFFDHNTRERKSVIRVIASDTGIGMDKDELNMIFNKFERGKEVSHYHTDGTGLGMYIGKKVVEVHKGKIWAESEGKGKGSRFILELPVG